MISAANQTGNEASEPWRVQPGSDVLLAPLVERSLPLCPELRLYLLSDEVNLEARVSELLAIDTAPYWAFCWGSGQALARYVLDHPTLVRGRRVVDFGAGSGVVAIAAARAGASAVCAVDRDPLALRACTLNAAFNGVELELAPRLPEQYDVLLGSDVLYEVGSRALVEQELARGRDVLLSDPLRPGNPRLSQAPVARFEVRTLPDVDRPLKNAVIYRLGSFACDGSSAL